MTRAEKEWEVYSGKYRTYIKTERGLAANTVEAYMRDLRRFRRFVTERYRLSPLEVETPVVEEFLNSLFEAGAEKSTQNRTLSGVSSFYDFLLRTDVLEKSPAEFVERPKSGHYLPDTLSIEEIDAILDAIDVSTAHGYRNRTMIEMLYSCGLRVSELTSLHISDLFFDEGFIRVLGKGSKQRLIPVSDRCTCRWRPTCANTAEYRAMKNPPIRFSSTATAGSCRALWCSTPSRRPLRPPESTRR